MMMVNEGGDDEYFDDCGLEFVSPGESVTASTTLTIDNID
jgi:hypothetical protein